MKVNKNNIFAKECISLALISLMKTKPISEITVTEIVNKAGVSRMTYYRNYEVKEDILKDYFKTVLANFYDNEEYDDINTFGKFKNIKGSINYFLKYKDFALCLINANLTHILLHCLNDYIINKAKRLNLDYNDIYLYAYSGALFNIYLEMVKGNNFNNFEIVGPKLERLAVLIKNASK